MLKKKGKEHKTFAVLTCYSKTVNFSNKYFRIYVYIIYKYIYYNYIYILVNGKTWEQLSSLNLEEKRKRKIQKELTLTLISEHHLRS